VLGAIDSTYATRFLTKNGWAGFAVLRAVFRNSVRAVDRFNIPVRNFVEIGRQIEI